MCSKELLLLACLLLLGGLRLTSTTTTTTFVAAMSIANQDLDRYFRTTNATQILATEDRILIDFYNYAFLNYTYRNEYGMEERVSFPEEKARYGEGLVANRQGILVHVSAVGNVTDDTACSPHILGTNGTAFPHRQWIALVRRGRCTFEEKVKHVCDHGAVAVIIYNDKQVNTLEKMQIKDQKRDITAVITYLDIGLQMARIVDLGMEMEAAITLGRSGSRPLNSLNKTSVLFVSISFIVLMVISLVWLLFYYIQRFRYLQTKDQQSRQLCSVTKKAIMKIPTKTGKSSDEKDLDSDCCAICIEAYKPSDCIRVLPCKHEFHKNCIDPWLIEHRTCPMCKLDVLKFYGFVVGDQIQTTPSPQHMPPNIANLGGGENDVEVIVVALAPPFSAAQQSSQTRQQHHHQTQATHASSAANSAVGQQQQQQMQTQLPAATTTTAAVVALAHAQHQQTQQQAHTHAYTHHCINCASSSGSSHSHCNCSSQMQGDKNCCNQQQQQQQQQCNSCNSCQHSCGHAHSGNTNNVASVATTNIVRRNSAPLVLQVSTASHQVTDV